jgi:hypothetical protein
MDPKAIAEQLKGGGWKTYAAGVLMIIWAGAGVYVGAHGPDAAVGFFTSGLGLIGVRHKLDSISLPQNVVEKAKE